MRAEIKIRCDNAAFCDSDTSDGESPVAASIEVARILRRLAKRIDGHPHFSPGHSQALLDTNGNTVGHLDVFEN